MYLQLTILQISNVNNNYQACLVNCSMTSYVFITSVEGRAVAKISGVTLKKLISLKHEYKL